MKASDGDDAACDKFITRKCVLHCRTMSDSQQADDELVFFYNNNRNGGLISVFI